MTKVRDSIEHVAGFGASGVHSGIKQADALDFSLIVSDTTCAVGGVFTTNQVKAAPVLVDMARLERNSGGIRAVVTNSGCANACTRPARYRQCRIDGALRC